MIITIIIPTLIQHNSHGVRLLSTYVWAFTDSISTSDTEFFLIHIQFVEQALPSVQFFGALSHKYNPNPQKLSVKRKVIVPNERSVERGEN